MQTFYKRFSVIAGFVVLLAVLIANALITRHQLDLQIRAQSWVAHTRQVLYELSQTESLLKDAETGQRGYLYTSDARYLTPYVEAIAQVEPSIDSLAKLTAGNAREQAQIPELRRLSKEKLDELAQTLALFRAGNLDEAKAIVLSDAGLMHMNAIRAIIDHMAQEETTLEETRAEQYQESIRSTIASIYLANLLAVVCLVLLAFYILREMEAREKHAQEIRAQEEWFRVTLTSIGDGVIATDREGKVSFLNPLAEKLTGHKFADAKGKKIEEVFPIFNEMTREQTENPVKQVMELGRAIGLANHTVLLNLDGTFTPIEDSAAPIRDDRNQLLGVVLVFRDATHERKAQEILRRTEKLAAAARLSATVAHEINNPLEAVVNLVYIAKAAAGASDSVTHPLTLAEQELERIAHLTRQTLGFYRESRTPELIELTALIDSVLLLYSNKFRSKNISVVCEFEECPQIRGVQGELKQVVSNLISNAADAVEQNGTIRVRLHRDREANDKLVQVVIEDDGPGVAAEDMDRIFEPFFTTKQDVGTGLGLWVSKEIVNRHGGRIVVSESHSNEAAHGAAFTIQLPIAGEDRNGSNSGN
jgi:PAS domain S-box-containing protein